MSSIIHACDDVTFTACMQRVPLPARLAHLDLLDTATPARLEPALPALARTSTASAASPALTAHTPGNTVKRRKPGAVTSIQGSALPAMHLARPVAVATHAHHAKQAMVPKVRPSATIRKLVLHVHHVHHAFINL